MILGFMQKFPWGNKPPTNFREKILASCNYIVLGRPDTAQKISRAIGAAIQNPAVGGFRPKIHTMRADPHNRWKSSMSIQMVYRGPKYSILDHFNKSIPELETCVSVQEIRISYIYKNEYVETKLPLRTIKGPRGTFDYYPAIWIDGRQLRGEEIETLALNDGFNNVNDFFRWFNKDWQWKIIHWTNFKY